MIICSNVSDSHQQKPNMSAKLSKQGYQHHKVYHRHSILIVKHNIGFKALLQQGISELISARLFICALWSPAGKGLTSWLSFVVSNCEFVTFPLVSWVR